MDHTNEINQREIVDGEDSLEQVPLQTSWTFWLDQAISGITAEQFKDHLKKIHTFKTVQGFWSVFNNIPKPDQIQVRYSYHMMRGNIYPIWEDKQNENGGTWRFKCDKKDTDKVWQEVVLAAIGEQFTSSVSSNDEIVGVTVSIREQDDIVQIWNTEASEASNASVIEKVHELVPDVKFVVEFYKPHRKNHGYGRS